MPKPATYPKLFDDCLTLSIKKLIEWKYLKPNQKGNKVITWSRNGEKTAQINLEVNTTTEQPFVILDYKYKDEPRKYKVSIVSKTSNLGKGLIYYFVCPQTQKRCRHLYNVGGWFLHRTAFKGCMYQKQTESKKWRSWLKDYAFMGNDDIYQQLYKKHFKTHYKGKPTKQYFKLSAKIEQIEKTYKNADKFRHLLKGK